MPSEAAAAGAIAADGVARRTSPKTILVSLGALLPVAGFFAFTSLLNALSSGGSDGGFGLVVVALSVVAALFQCVAWWVRTYTVSREQLVIDEGILSRHHRVIPYNRVQQVDVHQNLISQLFSVAELRVSTAGEAGATTVKLVFLDHDTAEGLRAFVLRRREELQRAAAVAAADPVATGGAPGVVTPPVADQPETVLLSLDAGKLVMAVVTHSSLLVGAAVAGVIGLWIATAVALGTSDLRTAGAFGVALLVLVVVEAFIALQLTAAHVLGKYGYTLSVKGDDLHLRYGVLEVRNLTVPRRRVQHITIDDNPIRRALGLAAIKVRTASGSAGAGEHATTQLEVPIIARRDVDDLLARMMGNAWWTPPPLSLRGEAARKRAVRRRVLFLALVAAGPAVALAASGRPVGLLLLGLAALGVPWGRVAHKRAGHGQSPEVVAVAHGVLHHRIDVVPIARVQSCRTTTSPFQRMNGVATFHIDIAGTGATVLGLTADGGQAPHLFDMEADRAGRQMRTLPRASVAAHRPAS